MLNFTLASLMRFFAHIGYKGTAYFGWQRQPLHTSVQAVIEAVFKELFKADIPIRGCGRTDTGVHASQYFFHFDLVKPPEFDLKIRLNFMLPVDIAVYDVIPVANDANARHDAVRRKYDYFFHTYKDPFLSASSSYYPLGKLDLEAMTQAVSLLPHYQDYRAFCKAPDKQQNTICNIDTARLTWNTGQSRFRLTISSDRFLFRMIRLLTSNILEIGEGKLSLEKFEDSLSSGKKGGIFKPAHPHGLYLSEVSYPYLQMEARTDTLPVFQNVF